ncbi:MAG: exostosin domain-containing protein [Solirubrobacterales bacterium]
MASVHLLSAAREGAGAHPKARLDLEQMRAAARADRLGLHDVVEDPRRADLILFVETSVAAGHYFELVRAHPIYREFTSKSYLFSATDKVIPFLPGVYASIERRWYWPSWTRSGHYVGVKEEGALRYDPDHRPSRLFSFVGRANMHRVRERIMRLRHPDAILIDTQAEALADRQGESLPLPPEEFVARYVRAINDCAFVLCPRGGGAASFRLFETMMLGRVPVIISDQWVPPVGPDWDRVSVRVGERRIEEIPRLLEAHAADARAMGEAARATWLEWFAPDTSFHRIVDWCLELARSAPRRSGVRRYAPHLQMLRPYHSARWVAKRIGRGGPAAL